MFAHVITFDLSSLHSGAHEAVLKHALANGLSSWTETVSGEMVQLPNTTVTGWFATTAEADQAFNRAVAAAEFELFATITVTKRLTIPQASPGTVISNNRRPKMPLADLFFKRPQPVASLSLLGRVRA